MSAASTSSASSLYALRRWPVWIGLGLLRLCAHLPYAGQLFLGRRLGDVMRWREWRRRRIAEINIGLCFPERTPDQQRQLLIETYHSLGISLLECAMSWWGSGERLRHLHRLEGEEHLRAALQQGKGVLLLGGHYTTLEISGRLLAFHFADIRPIFKRAHDAVFNAVMEKARRRRFDDLLLNTDFRAILRSLQENKIVWYAPDQDFGPRQSVFAPFMGVPTATLTITTKLARLSGAPVLPFYSQRLPGTQGYIIKVMPPLRNFPSGDDVADATRINQTIEAQVRAAPEQYLWVHRRFKTRPGDDPKLYPKRKRRRRRALPDR